MRRSSTKGTGKHSAREILAAFFEEKPRKTIFGNYRIEGDKLEYRAQCSADVKTTIWHDAADFAKAKKEIGEQIRELDGKLVDSDGKTVLLEGLSLTSTLGHGAKVVYYETNLIAQKLKRDNGTIYLGNRSTLELVGRSVSYGHESLNSGDTEIQAAMRADGRFTMIPMNAFGDADFETFQMIEQSEPTRFTYQNGTNYDYHSGKHVPTYATGEVTGMLFDLDGERFLVDADQQEMKNKQLNLFVTRVRKSVSSIAQAYQSLKPKAVVDAEAAGKSVLRQGPLFFIPVDAPVIPELTDADKILLLANQSFHADDVIRYLANTGKRAKENEAKVEKLLAMVPKKESLSIAPHRNPTGEVVIVLDNVTYVTGGVKFEGRTDLKLKVWYTVHYRTNVGPKKDISDVSDAA